MEYEILSPLLKSPEKKRAPTGLVEKKAVLCLRDGGRGWPWNLFLQIVDYRTYSPTSEDCGPFRLEDRRMAVT